MADKLFYMFTFEENLIGEGGYAEVYLGKLEDGNFVAIKRLTRGCQEDMIIWSFSKDGRFTVRSISILLFYASLCEPRTPRSGGGWRKLWALKVSH